MSYSLHLGDCRDILATIADNSIDSIVTDPPYELGFMGKSWDNSGIAYDVTVWQHCLRVLKPGGHLIAFGGSRTYHRLAVAIEDAKFEIRDQIQWIYGSGFPKSHNLDGDHAGWGTALKPAHEPAVLARKPLCGTVADNVTTWGVGAINVDGTRIPSDDGFERAWDKPVRTNISNGAQAFATGASAERGTHTVDISANKPLGGRWPANVIFDEEAAQVLGEPSRFFYIAKASKAEREAGLDDVERVKAGAMNANTGDIMKLGQASLDGNHKSIQPRANHHPTVKPIALMRYLVRMVTPKGGVVLDPFTGSGSTGCAAVLENCNFIGIDIMPEYIEIAERRIAYYALTDLMK